MKAIKSFVPQKLFLVTSSRTYNLYYQHLNRKNSNRSMALKKGIKHINHNTLILFPCKNEFQFQLIRNNSVACLLSSETFCSLTLQLTHYRQTFYMLHLCASGKGLSPSSYTGVDKDLTGRDNLSSSEESERAPLLSTNLCFYVSSFGAQNLWIN